ncbi:uncharacterized protein C2845_PM16G18080 [Panicum miliaceum]|uniref:Uncharacterized protein n=1 Tax=Panicum miliaceum TaxID=4540 RepID=A0A3L6PYX3_PANMI|nr:uncharacterized protein C2845_PM16G18080 [Panicum miliaceum]
MELASSDLAALGAAELVRVLASIPLAAPRTFVLLTACLVFPLSFAVLAHSLFTHPILLRIQSASSGAHSAEWLRPFAYQFLYFIVLFTFSLLSTASTFLQAAQRHLLYVLSRYVLPRSAAPGAGGGRWWAPCAVAPVLVSHQNQIRKAVPPGHDYLPNKDRP